MLKSRCLPSPNGWKTHFSLPTSCKVRPSTPWREKSGCKTLQKRKRQFFFLFPILSLPLPLARSNASVSGSAQEEKSSVTCKCASHHWSIPWKNSRKAFTGVNRNIDMVFPQQKANEKLMARWIEKNSKNRMYLVFFSILDFALRLERMKFRFWVGWWNRFVVI